MSKYKAYLKKDRWGDRHIKKHIIKDTTHRFSGKSIIHAIECGRTRDGGAYAGSCWELKHNVFDGIVYKDFFVKVYKNSTIEAVVSVPYYWKYDKNTEEFTMDIVPLGEDWSEEDWTFVPGKVSYYFHMPIRSIYKYKREDGTWGGWDDIGFEWRYGRNVLSFAKARRVYELLDKINWREDIEYRMIKEINYRYYLGMTEFEGDD